jgi:hypothetical protein
MERQGMSAHSVHSTAIEDAARSLDRAAPSDRISPLLLLARLMARIAAREAISSNQTQSDAHD